MGEDHADLFAERFEVQRRQEGFALTEARDGAEPAGLAFGVNLQPTTPWWRNLTTTLPPEVITERPGRTFALLELLVWAPWRRQHVARGLHDLLLHDRPGERATLTVLSPAVNDTFTALTCINWLGDSLSKIAVDWHPQSCHRDGLGVIRLITVPVSYERLVQRSFEKVRQAADGMPAALIRQLDAQSKVMAVAPPGRSQVILDQATMIARISERIIREPADQADVAARHEALLALHAQETRPEPDGSTA